ncbi:fimbrillin family protein [Parabacteroides sp.]
MKHILFGYAFSLLLVACTAEEDIGKKPIGDGLQPVLLQPNFYTGQPSTRSIVEGLESSEATPSTLGKISSVMLYVTNADNGFTPYAGVEDNISDNLVNGLSQFTAKGSGGTLTWEGVPAVNLYNVQARVFAFSPSNATFQASTNSIDHKITDVKVPADMTFNGANVLECNTADYLYGSASGNVGTSSQIIVSNADGNSFKPNIHLQHALAQVVFQLQAASGRQPTDYDYVKKITLTSANNAFLATSSSNSATMKLEDGALGNTSSVGTLTFIPNSGTDVKCGTNGNPKVVAYGLVAPLSSAPTDIVLTIFLGKVGSDEHKRELKVTTFPQKQWTKGLRYVYNLTLTDRNIEVQKTTIELWTPSPGTGDFYPDGFTH